LIAEPVMVGKKFYRNKRVTYMINMEQ